MSTLSRLAAVAAARGRLWFGLMRGHNMPTLICLAGFCRIISISIQDVGATIVTDVKRLLGCLQFVEAPGRNTGIEKMNDADIQFFVAAHRKFYFPTASRNHHIVGLGGYNHISQYRSMSDNTDINIGTLNKHYCELSGWYWLLKNVIEVGIIGLLHYRRYFLLDPNHPAFNGERILKLDPSYENFAYLTANERGQFALSILSHWSMIVPKRLLLGGSISEHYKKYHIASDWGIFIESIKANLSGDEINLSFFERCDYIFPYNMMVCKVGDFARYMEKLFQILFWIDDRVPFSEDPYQCRRAGFLSERFLGYYIHLHAVSAYEVPIVVTDPTTSM